MKYLFSILTLVVCLVAPLAAEEPAAPASVEELPRVEIVTSKGSIVVEVYPDKAPKTVKAFLANVASGFYEGTIFHRVMRGFMIQGGGFGSDLNQRPTTVLLENEADNGLSNDRGTIAMARRNEPHTASVQFYINHVDNPALNHTSKVDGRTWGYTVFGRVLEGMEVVDAIAAEPTQRKSYFANLPVDTVSIEKANWLNGPPPEVTRTTGD